MFSGLPSCTKRDLLSPLGKLNLPSRSSWPVAHSCTAGGMPLLPYPSYTTALLFTSHATPIWRGGATSWTPGMGVRSSSSQAGRQPLTCTSLPIPLERLATAPFLAVIAFLAPGSLTSRHALSPTNNSTRSHWRAKHGVTSRPLSGYSSAQTTTQLSFLSTRGRAAASNVMSLLRCLFLVCALQNFNESASYVEGVSYGIADSLSRQDFCRFRTLAPQAAAITDTARPLPNIPGEPSLVPCFSTHSNR